MHVGDFPRNWNFCIKLTSDAFAVAGFGFGESFCFGLPPENLGTIDFLENWHFRLPRRVLRTMPRKISEIGKFRGCIGNYTSSQPTLAVRGWSHSCPLFAHPQKECHEILTFSEKMAHQLFIENLRNARVCPVRNGFPRSFGWFFAHTWTNLLTKGFVHAWVSSIWKNDIYRSSGECMSVIFREIEISVLN